MYMRRVTAMDRLPLDHAQAGIPRTAFTSELDPALPRLCRQWEPRRDLFPVDRPMLVV